MWIRKHIYVLIYWRWWEMVLYLMFSPQYWSLDLLRGRQPNNAISICDLWASLLHFTSISIFDWLPVNSILFRCTNSARSKRLVPHLRFLRAMHVIAHPATAFFKIHAAVGTLVSGIRTFSNFRGLLKLVRIFFPILLATATILIGACPLGEQVGDIVSFGWGWTFRLFFGKFMGI
jgi:hypothetical protein